VRYCGATPVLVDVVSPTLNIDPADIERRLTPRTRGIIPVHLYGHPADMAAINAIAKRHSLFVLEDAAEAHGARWLGRSVGSLGTCAAFSFFGNKIVTTGEGGMVTTDDDELAAKLRLLRGQGMDSARRYWFPVIGYNYRLTNLQAAIGLAQMETVESALAARSRLVDRYDQALAPLSRSLVLPRAGRQVAPVCWLYTVFLRNGDGRRRDAVMRLLDEAGIETRPTFHPLHTLPPHQDGRSFPVAEVWAPRGISLPTHEHINTADIERITDALELALDATSALVGRNRTRTTRMVEAEPADGMRRQTSSAPTT
jgi:perosamine synthetase